MNPILQSALGSIIRFGLAYLAGYLVKAGIWTNSNAEIYITSITLTLLTLGWSLWEKYKSRIKFMTALSLPAGSTENDVTAKIASGTTIPTVLTPSNTIPGVPAQPKDKI